MLSGLLVFGSIVAAVIWFVTSYNNLVAAAQRATQAWGNIDVLLRQRHDELPRLIETCQEHMKYEQAAFDRVLEARGEIFAARQTQDAAALGRAERALRSELGTLRGLAEGYPELQASQTLTVLQQRIAALEAGIAERREIYNDAVRQNNVAIGQFPGSIVAMLGGFRPLETFDFEPEHRAG